jgi:hypothetical protein
VSRRRAADADRTGPDDPFRVLGLPKSAELADDEVRAAWRVVAAATHPDRADGGNPGAFAVAAGAYAMLRTKAARAEVLAGGEPGTAAPAAARIARTHGLPGPIAVLAARIWCGRPGRLALRVVAAAAVAVLAVAAVGWQPASAGVITGALTWLMLTGRADLAASPVRDR